MNDEDDVEEIAQEIDPSKILRTEMIKGKEYQIVEITKIWLIL